MQKKWASIHEPKIVDRHGVISWKTGAKSLDFVIFEKDLEKSGSNDD